MSAQIGSGQHLFLVRIWQEPAPEHASAWRGMVEHVHFGQRMYFTSLNDLSDFIALRLESLSECGKDEENL